MAWMGGLSSFAEPPAETLQEQMEVQVFASPVCVFVCNVRERVQMFFLATTLMEDLVTFSCKSWPWRFVVRRKTCNNGEKGCCVLMLKEKYSRRKTCPHAVCVCQVSTKCSGTFWPKLATSMPYFTVGFAFVCSAWLSRQDHCHDLQARTVTGSSSVEYLTSSALRPWH